MPARSGEDMEDAGQLLEMSTNFPPERFRAGKAATRNHNTNPTLAHQPRLWKKVPPAQELIAMAGVSQ
jgi:hypothetical protein